jgi:hypothetical protein
MISLAFELGTYFKSTLKFFPLYYIFMYYNFTTLWFFKISESWPHTVKKVRAFPVPSRDVTYQTLPAGNNSYIPAGDGKTANFFFCVNLLLADLNNCKAIPELMRADDPEAME